MEICIPVVARVADYTVVPVMVATRYVTQHQRYVSDLKEKCEILVDLRKRVLDDVKTAEMDWEEIKKNVSLWLVQVDECIHQVEMFLKNEQTGCLDFRARHSRSRKAREMTSKAMKLIGRQINYDRVSYKIVGLAHHKTEIMLALKDEDIRILGIFGMGGVGKTTLARHVAQEQGVFDKVVWLTVCQNPPDYDALKEHLLSELNRMSANAILLIVLDDVWKPLDLDDLGINPDQLSNCKIIMISRSIAVLLEMGCEKIVQLNSFNSEDSWQLFKGTLGDDVDFESDRDLKLVAKKIMSKCAGLPIAIVTIANTLRGKPLPVWKDALHQLEYAPRDGTPGMSREMYTSLQLSYEHIESEEARSIFLICSLFPEDFNIQMDHLMLYGWGLQLFSGIGTLIEARNRLYALVIDLEAACRSNFLPWRC